MNMYSVRILQKGLHLVNVVQLVSVKDAPPLQGPGGGGEGKYPQIFLFLGRLCIVLMENSFYCKPIHVYSTGVRPMSGFCF